MKRLALWHVALVVFAVALVGCSRDSEGPKVGHAEKMAPVAPSVSFDALTDKWVQPVKGVVSRKGVGEFVSAFKSLPIEKRRAALQRACHLIPEENSRLLVGLLMDSEVDEDSVRLAFVEILNRSDEIKLPILRAIAHNQKHPCREEATFILGMTGKIEEDE